MLQPVLTVPQAARRIRKNPETIRRWIREGKLPAKKVGSQHVIEEADLQGLLRQDIVPGLSPFAADIVAILREQRASH